MFKTLQCSFYEHRQYKIVYRRYASLFFMAGVDDDEVSLRHFLLWLALYLILFINTYITVLKNELGILEFIHAFVEILDKHFGQVLAVSIF